jgi:hypothetical protein
VFSLDQAIAEWRREMAAAGIKTSAVLDELESHLREDVEQHVRAGSNGPEAFEVAVRRLGQARSLKAEFEMAGEVAGQGVKFWLRVITFVFGFCYLAVSAYGLLRHDMAIGERVLGFSALAASVLLSLGSYSLSLRFLGTADPRTKKAFTLGGAVLMVSWLMYFVFIILPRCEFEIAGLVIALLWAIAPGAVVVGIGLALEDGARKGFAAR